MVYDNGQGSQIITFGQITIPIRERGEKLSSVILAGKHLVTGFVYEFRVDFIELLHGHISRVFIPVFAIEVFLEFEQVPAQPQV